MSRHGYSDDCDDNWAMIRYQGWVKSAVRGKRGQQFLRELRDALKALPEPVLCYGEMARDGEVCALGAIAKRRLVASGLAPEQAEKQIQEQYDLNDWDSTAERLGIAATLAREVMFCNDEWYEDFDWQGQTKESVLEQHQRRYRRVLRWVEAQIQEPAITSPSSQDEA